MWECVQILLSFNSHSFWRYECKSHPPQDNSALLCIPALATCVVNDSSLRAGMGGAPDIRVHCRVTSLNKRLSASSCGVIDSTFGWFKFGSRYSHASCSSSSRASVMALQAAITGFSTLKALSAKKVITSAAISLEGETLAKSILDGIAKKIEDVSSNRGLKEEIWFVVRKARMASVLIEVGFVTNEVEGTRLTKELYLQKVADGIYNGITEFVTSYEKNGR